MVWARTGGVRIFRGVGRVDTSHVDEGKGSAMMVTDWMRWSALSVLLAFGPAHSAGRRVEAVADDQDPAGEI